MNNSKKNIILIHGLWNTPNIFNGLIKSLKDFDIKIFTPHLPHSFGRTNLYNLAIDLDVYINSNLGPNTPIDLLGFSMGGLIARIWLQKMNGSFRTKRFISLGSPNNGTIVAQLVPFALFPGIAQMKRNSSLIRDLNNDFSALDNVNCISYFCPWDLMVIPGWEAVLPVGSKFSLPVLYHKELIKSPLAIKSLVKSIIYD